MARILPVNPKKIINQVQSNSMDGYRKQVGKLSAYDEILKVLDPQSSGLYPHYMNDWAGFMRNEMGARIPPILQNVVDAVMTHELVVVPSGTQLGKSWLGAMLALTFYKIYEQCQVYLIAAPPRNNLEINLLSKIKGSIQMHKGVFIGDKVTSMSVVRHPEQFVQGMIIPTQGTDEQKEARFSGKHAPHMLVLMDEGDAIPDFVFEAVDGWGSGGVTFRQVVFFNPKVKQGEVFRLIDEGRAYVVPLCAFDHPNVLTGESIIPGAVTQRDTIRRIVEWTDPIENIDDEKTRIGCFEVPDFLCDISVKNRAGDSLKPVKAGWRKVKETNQEFSYKVLGEYPPAPESVTIPEEWIQLARYNHDVYVADNIIRGVPETTPPDTTCVMGFDVSDEGGDHNCICLRYDEFPVFARWKGHGANDSANRGIRTYKSNPVRHAYVDRGGVGAGVPGKMQENGCEYTTGVYFSQRARKAVGLEQKISFSQKRDELYWLVREWLRPENGAMLPDNKRLLRGLRGLRHSEFNGKLKFITKEKIRKDIGYSPDELDALALTFQSPRTDFGSI